MSKIRIARKMKSGDFVLVLVTMALVIFGIVMVFSASYYNSISRYGDAYYYLKRSVAWAGVGTCAMLFTANFDYRRYAYLAKPALIISIVLLLLIFTPLGVERNNAVRWLNFGITVMPGEIAKVCAIVFVAWFLSKDPSRIKSFTRGVVPLLALCGIYGVLIIKQPNLSTALTVCGIILGMMFVAGLSWFYVVGAVAAGGAGIVGIILSGKEYWLDRLTTFLDPFANPLDEGYQVIQSLLAMGSGGVFGLGLGKSIQKNMYLPEPQNDFIFAIIAEELGLVGCILVIIAFMILIWRGMHVALNAPDYFGTLLAAGITIMIALQVVLNIAVVTSSMPATGIALPFISYGGNALLLCMGSMGILLNISRYAAK